MNITASIDWFELASAVLFALAFVGCLYNAADAWQNMTAVLKADGGRPSGRLVAIALDDLLRSFLKVAPLALAGLAVNLLRMLVGPSPMETPLQIALVLGERLGNLLFAAGLLTITAVSLWVRRFVNEPEVVTGATNGNGTAAPQAPEPVLQTEPRRGAP